MKRIIVCIKPVPDPKHWNQVTMDPVTQTLKREGVPTILNPLDKHALEAALLARDTLEAEVVLLSMAPPFAEGILREGLAMGADRAVLLSDPLFAGSDSLATAHILAAGCRWIGEFELLLLGNMSVDGSTAQVCSQVAEFLDLPSAMHVIGMEWQDPKQLLVTQKTEFGWVKLEATLPLVIGVRRELNKPRYTSFAGILAAESKPVQVLSHADLDLDLNLVGLKGSPTQMAGMELRRFERARERLQGDLESIVQQLAERIAQQGVI